MSVVNAAHAWNTNADLIADVALLGYLKATDRVLDPTYGRGIWWQKFKPNELVTHDISIDGVDFRDLPHDDESFDAVAYDPPYVCVSLDTQIMTQHGWRHWDEVEAGDLTYTLNHATGKGSWRKIEEVVVQPAAPRQMVSLEGSSHSSLTTLDHRWPVIQRNGDRSWATSSTFLADHVVPTAAADEGLSDVPLYSDAFVELVAWFWTEGTLERSRTGARMTYGNISQSHVVNAANVSRIRAAFLKEFGPSVDTFPRVGRLTDGVPRWRECVDGHKQVFWFSADLGAIFTEVAPDLVPSHEFLTLLTPAQLELFIATSIAGDGHLGDDGVATLGQKRREMAEAFQMACVMAGYSTSLRPDKSKGWLVRVKKRQNFKPSRNRPVVVGSLQPVWCIRVENESWLAMRNGTVYFTGNCVGGRSTTTMPDFHNRYGMTDAPKSPAELQELINGGLTECARVVRAGGFILVKVQDYISSGELWTGTYFTINHGLSLGLLLFDRFEHVAGVRPQPPGRRQVHARRNLSTLLVFKRPITRSDGVRRNQAKKRLALQAIKLERGCADCGYAGHPAALDFDHRPDEVKSISIGRQLSNVGLSRLLQEVEKCDVVCANCHRIRSINREQHRPSSVPKLKQNKGAKP